MSFYIDTEPAGDDDEGKDAGGNSASFYLDTTSSASSQQQKKSKSDSRKRKRRKETPEPQQQQEESSAGVVPDLDGVIPKIFYRSVSTGELGRKAAEETANSAGGAGADATDGPPKSRRPRFSRQALNSRFFDQVAAVASDGNAITGGGGASGPGGLEAFRPGELSDRLRSALGLEANQLPTHIYRMRELGYPPGWMLEARVMPTGVTIIEDSNEQKKIDEIQQQEQQQHPKFDVTRLVKYPGFNCPLQPGVRDQHRQLGFSPMRLDDHLSTFIHFLASHNQIHASDAYHTRRRRLAKQTSEAAAEALEVEEEEEEEASSLDDLEARRLELLRQLEADPELEELDSCSSSANGELQDPEAPEDAAADVKISSPTSAAVVGTAFGSPVFTNYTAKLPNPNNFNRDIEQFRPYENLPSSANGSGGYAKVNEVVKKIRESLPRIV